MQKQWVVRPDVESAQVDGLSKDLGISPVLAKLLIQRGVETKEAAEIFFNPSLSTLHDPFLMKDMDISVKRVEQALQNNEKIMVYGDYDVDGTTAVALMYKFLRQLGHKNLSFYIPDRYIDGYGISTNGIDHAAENGVTLVIALDCGIKAVEEIRYAKSKGVDFIICDHHLQGAEIPEAVAVLDPKRVDCEYPFKELSGCGVGFKLVQAYCQKHNIDFSEIEHLLDLLVVSIASDIVQMMDENRTLALYGLERLNENPSSGLSSIINICRLSEKITMDDIVFKIGPRINAGGRMRVILDEGAPRRSGGDIVVQLLIEGNDSAARESGAMIDEYNSGRKVIDRHVTQEAFEYVKSHLNLDSAKSIVIYNKEWIKGIVGIVASRLIESYYRPTVVLTMCDGMVTGSARSIPGFDLYQAVEHCSDLLENFGGHICAVGLTMKPENVDAFTAKFTKYIEEHIDPDMLVPQVEVDTEIVFSDVTDEFRETLNKFQPFGPGNTAPIFVTYGVSGNYNAKLVGLDMEHLRMDLTQKRCEKPYRKLQAIAFGQPTMYNVVKSGHPVDVCYTIVENHFKGTISPQLRVKDIKKGSYSPLQER